jgi:hypothetical protein
LSRFAEEQARRMVRAYINQPNYRERNGNDLIRCYYDPIEDEPEYKKIIDEVRIEAENKYPKEELGRCSYIWWYMEEKLPQQGIDWLSPATMNPHIRFD